MFKPGHDNMRPESTPERVYALSRMFVRGPLSREALIEKISLSEVFGSADEVVAMTLKVAQELGLITLRDGHFELAVDPTVLNDYSTYRRYTASVAFSNLETLFFRTSATFIREAQKVAACTSWSEVQNILRSSGVNELSENDVKGWRFWVSFFGLGYLQSSLLIPNGAIRIRDVLWAQTTWEKNEAIPVAEFMKWLENKCPELREGREDALMGLLISNGLRTLHQRRYLEIMSIPDAAKWQLYKIDADDFNVISHIRIMEAN